MSVGNDFDGPFASNGLACIPIVGDKLLSQVFQQFETEWTAETPDIHEALLYQASQQYETEWTAETPDIHEGFSIPGFTTIRD